MATWRSSAIGLCMLTCVWIGCGRGEVSGQGSDNATDMNGAGGDAGAGGDPSGTGGAPSGTGGTGGAGGDACVPRSPTAGCAVAPWFKRFGDASFQSHGGTAIDAAGNIYVSGAFDGQMDFGGGPLQSAGGLDVFLAKLDPLGDPVWSKRFGDVAGQGVDNIALDSAGNVILVGELKGTVDFGGGALTSAGEDDIYVAKLDPEGNHLWSMRFGDASLQSIYDVAVDSADNVVLTGSFKGLVDFGGGPLVATSASDIFVAKLGPQGDHVFSRRFAGTYGGHTGRGLAVDAAGNVFVVGTFLDQVDFGGGPLVCQGEYDVFLVKLDASGDHVWSKSFGNPEPQYGDYVGVDGVGNVVVTGFFRAEIDFGLGPLVYVGDYDVYVVKLDPAGNPLWNKRFGSPQLDVPRGIHVTSAGDIFVIGQFEGDVDFGGGFFKGPGIEAGWDTFALKLDASGGHVWSMQLFDQSHGLDRRTLIPDGAGNVVLAGSFDKQVDFGVGSLMGVGSYDIFVAKLAK